MYPVCRNNLEGMGKCTLRVVLKGDGELVLYSMQWILHCNGYSGTKWEWYKCKLICSNFNLASYRIKVEAVFLHWYRTLFLHLQLLQGTSCCAVPSHYETVPNVPFPSLDKDILPAVWIGSIRRYKCKQRFTTFLKTRSCCSCELPGILWENNFLLELSPARILFCLASNWVSRKLLWVLSLEPNTHFKGLFQCTEFFLSYRKKTVYTVAW